ncbi:hypothetical protein [Corallococcus terminator]|uniref:Uncharacterized protein n=1 Tax=Corallococcus terminator TaxID=2316733 RepID=A0A3A8HGC2_9BACT|nr:hypothetical protein [Corallococcus terminator]RKG70287.1 hypothetical protein D7V88_39850 [Corallococcus terminator]
MFKHWSRALLAAGTLMGTGCQPPGTVDAESAAPAPFSERGGIGILSHEQELTTLSPQTVDGRKSVAVTEASILAPFTLTNVLQQLVAQNGGSGLNATQLFRQLWDTQNPSPGQPDLQPGAHCNDNGGSLNGFPYGCRTQEGAQAAANSPTSINSYSAIGLYNRFDLAPASGAHCGEYRVVFGKTSGGAGRAFLILEASLPNPRPDLGLDGCRPVQSFWRDLSAKNVADRGTALRDFYFTGLPGFSPVFHINNYGLNPDGTGQVRINVFIEPLWVLKEFKLQRQCPGGVCTLKFAPVTVKTNPFGELFNPASTHPLAASFRTHFVNQVPALAADNLNTFNYAVPDQFNAVQGDSSTFNAVDEYSLRFGSGPSAFRNDIQARLDLIGSDLTPTQIVARAQALSCSGCHQRSDSVDVGTLPDGSTMRFPSAAGFIHNLEFTEPGPDGNRFFLSSALTQTFIPFRKQVMEGFLNAEHPLTPPSRFNLSGTASDGRFAYWVERRTGGVVMRASLDSGGEQLMAFNRNEPLAIATDGTHLYWTEAAGSILKLPVATPLATPTVLATGLTGLGGIATDGTTLFWTEGGAVRKMSNQGGTRSDVVTARSNVTGRLTVDGTHVYWQEGDAIRKVAKGGGTVSTLLTRASITGLASDGAQVWLAEDGMPGRILRVPVGGGAAVQAFTPTFNLTSVAVGGDHVVWTENRGPGTVMAKTK